MTKKRIIVQLKPLEKVRMRRQTAGLTQDDMAKLLFCSKGRYASIEQGKMYADINTALGIAYILQKSLEELFLGERPSHISILEAELRSARDRLYELGRVYQSTKLNNRQDWEKCAERMALAAAGLFMMDRDKIAQ